MLFRDRREAGRRLGTALLALAPEGALVLALPRGGVPVGYEVARALAAPLAVFVARKLPAPGEPELGIGAVAEKGVVYVDEAAVAARGVTEAEILRAAAVEMREIERRIARYRAGRPAPDVRGRTAILVDDGLATGGTARAALRALRRAAPSRLVLAVPVAPRGTAEALATEADAVAILATPEPFEAVGRWYDDFAQTPDEEVIALLRSRERELGSPA